MAKILYIASQRMPTEKAYGVQIVKMCEAFGDSGASVELLVPTRGNSTAGDIFDYYGVRQNFSVTTIKSPDFYFPGILDRIAFITKQWISAMKLIRVALSRGTDVIYSRDEFPVFLASFYSQRPTLVFEAHRFSSSRSMFYSKFKKAGIKIVAISKGVRDEFIKFGYKPENVLIAHDGVDLEEFKNLPDRKILRERLNLPQDKKIAMYIGQLLDWKGVDTLVRAASLVSDDTLVFIGGGTNTDIAQLKELDTKKIVRFEGPTSLKLLPQYLASADVLVLPNKKDGGISEFYTSPLKLFAYMASGRPIIASDLPSIREVLSEDTAFFFKPDDAEILTMVINKVINNLSEAEKRARQALEEVSRYAWSVRAGNILHFIKS